MIQIIDKTGESLNFSAFNIAPEVGWRIDDGAVTITDEQPPQSLLPRRVKTTLDPYSLIVQLIVSGADARTKAAEVVGRLTHCEITFSDKPQEHWVCDITGVMRTSYTNIIILEFTFAAQLYGGRKTETLTADTKQITVSGAKETYLNITCTSSGTVTLNGIEIACNGETVTIDSEKGIADMKKVEMTAFPTAVGVYPISVSGDTDGMTLTISYRPRY